MPTPRPLNIRYGLSTGTKSVVDGSGTLTDVGVLSSLLTTDKTNIVSAVNEVKGDFTNITTADVAEDQNYLYFTQSRARQSVTVTDTGGDGSLAYDNVSGVFTYTGPSATEVRAHFTGGTGVTITDGTVAIGQSVGTTDNVTFNNTTLTGVLYGPAQFVIDPSSHGDITGELIVLGNLTVDGTTTTINSTTVEIEDKTLVLSKSSTVPVEANNSGIVVNGANANILYAFTTDSWNANKTLKGVDGDASSPTYSFATDPGLGLYRSANDQLSLAINGAERFRLSNTLMTLISNVDLVFNRGTFNGTVTTATLTGNRMYTLPDVSGTLATTADLSQFASTTSAQLAGVISDETGTGSLVFATSPSLTTPSLGAATATSINKVAITEPVTGSTLTIADGKTLTFSNTLTFTGTDTSSVAFGTGGTVAYLGSNNQFTGSNTFTNTTGQIFRQAATQDGVLIRGRAGGTSSYTVEIVPTTLTASRTLTAPNVSGTIVTTGDTGTVTSTMIADGTITDTDISATAEISVSKLADGSARQLLQTNAAGTGVEWTSNIDVPGTLDVTGITTFDTLVSIGAAEPTTSQQIGWNTDKGTFDIGLLNGVVSPLGQDVITLCRNDTANPITKGMAVMVTDETDGNSGRLHIAPMVSNGTYPGYVFFGVAAQNIAAGADGYVRSFGEIKGVDTDVDEGGVDGQWAEGDILWCNPAVPGGFTKFEPQAPNLKLPVATVVSVGSNGIAMIRWDTGRRLRDLHDVESNGTTSNGELLVYNSSASRWEHGTTLPSLVVTKSLTVNGTDISESARDIEEARLIRKFGTVSIGTPGTVPFGVGPVIPPGMSLVGIGPDSYNVIDVYSGSVC